MLILGTLLFQVDYEEAFAYQVHAFLLDKLKH